MSWRRGQKAAAVVAAVLLVAAPALAANETTNFGFTTDATGWTTTNNGTGTDICGATTTTAQTAFATWAFNTNAWRAVSGVVNNGRYKGYLSQSVTVPGTGSTDVFGSIYYTASATTWRGANTEGYIRLDLYSGTTHVANLLCQQLPGSNVAGTTLTGTAVAVTPGTYTLRATIAYRNSGSNAATFNLDNIVVNSAPVGLAVTAPAGTKDAQLSWTDSSTSGPALRTTNKYRVYRGTTSGGETALVYTASTPYTDTSTTGNTTYYYELTDWDIGVNGTEENPGDDWESPRSLEVGPILTRPGAPTAVNFSGITQTNITVNWTAPTGGATTYKVERAPDVAGAPGTWADATTGVAGTSWSDSTRTCGTTYWYRVSGTNATGYGAVSTQLSQATTACPSGTLTVGNHGGTEAATQTICYNGTATDLDYFTLLASAADNIQSVTFTLSGPGAYLSTLALTDNANTQIGTAVSNPIIGNNTVTQTFAAPTGTAAQYKFKITPNAAMAVAGNHQFTGTVTAVTDSASFTKSYNDTGSATITVDNAAPSGVNGNITTSNITTSNIRVNWTNPASDFNSVIVVRKGSTISGTPVKGTSYAANDTLSDGAVVVYSGAGSGAGAASFFDNGSLTPNTQYFYKVFVRDNCAIWSAASNEVSATTNPTGTLTVGNFLSGSDAPSTTVCYNGTATDVDYFTLSATATGDTVSAFTVSLTGTTSVLSALSITDNAGSSLGSTGTISGSTTVNVTPFTAPTSATQYRVKISPNPAMAAGSYTFTGFVTDVSHSATFAKTLSDSAAGTITVDNQAPNNVTGLSTTNVTTTGMRVQWTNPGSDFSSAMVVRRTGATNTGTPAKGTTYAVNDPLPGSSGDEKVVAVGVVGGLFDDSGLAAGTTYYYRVFVRDACGIWSATGVEVFQSTSAAPTLTVGNHGGTEASTQTICYNGSATDLDYFTLLASTATNVTSVTLTLSGPGAYLSSLALTDNANTQIGAAVSNPIIGANTVTQTFAAPTGSAAQYKFKITPNAAMAVSGNHAFTGTVTAVTDSAGHSKIYNDTGSATITVDNAAPGNVTGLAVSSFTSTTVNLGWTNPGTDFSSVMVVRGTTTVTGTPDKGATYTVNGQLPGAADANEKVVAYGLTGTTFPDSGLSAGTTYYYKVFVRDACGIWSTGATVTQTTAPTLALGNGTPTPTSQVLCPGASAVDVSAFTVATTPSGTDTVNSLTVDFTNSGANVGAAGGIASATITNDAVTQTYATQASPSDSQAFSLSPTISATTSVTQYHVRASAKAHGSMPAVPGSNYPVTAVITAAGHTGTGSITYGNTIAGSGTITIDNSSSTDVTGLSASTPAAGQVSLTWSNPVVGAAPNDFGSYVVVLRSTASITDRPAEGTASYTAGATIGATTVACAGDLSSCLDSTGLTPGQLYYYKVFTRDSCSNWSVGVQTSITTAATLVVGNGTAPGSQVVCPGNAAVDVNAFTLAMSPTGSDTVSSLTVNFASSGAGASTGIATATITNDAVSQTYATQASPSDSQLFTLSPTIGVTGTSAQYHVRASATAHGDLPAPPGANYPVTAVITAVGHSGVGSVTNNNSVAGSGTITVDNSSSSDVTGLSASASAPGQVTVSWTNPATGAAPNDFGNYVVVLRSTSSISDRPSEGTGSYTAGGTIGSASIACVGNVSTCVQSSGLTPGATYYYKVFTRDSCNNWSVGVQTSVTTQETRVVPGTATVASTYCKNATVTAPFTGDTNNTSTTRIRRGTSAGGPFSNIGCEALNSPTSPRQCNDIGTLSAATPYYYEVFFADSTDGVLVNPPPTNPQVISVTTPLCPPLITLSGATQPGGGNIPAGNSDIVGRFTLSLDRSSVTVTQIKVVNTGTAQPLTDVLRLLLLNDSGGGYLGSATWDGTKYTALTNFTLSTGTNIVVRVVMVAAVGATSGRTFVMNVASSDLAATDSAEKTGGPITGNSFNLTTGPTQGSTNPAAPTVMLLNPANGTAVTGPDFRVQAQVYNPGGLGALTAVELSTNGGSSWAAMTQVTAYSPGPNSAVYERNLTGIQPGAYSLLARASNSVPLSANSGIAAITVVPASTGDGMLLVRDNSSQLCIDCHAKKSHGAQASGGKYGAWGVTCRDCHTPHSTSNIYLVREVITPPAVNGYQPAKTVKFLTKDVYYPDGGRSNVSYVNTDYSGPCQVCHTRTQDAAGNPRFRNTGSTTDHYTGLSSEACTNCHSHTNEFKGKTCIDCHIDPTTDTDDFASNQVPAKISETEWRTFGHGLPSATTYASGNTGAGLGDGGMSRGDWGCLYCHDDGVGHGATANPYRLANVGGADGMNGVCLVCHKGGGDPGYDPDGTNTAYELKNAPVASKVGKSHYNNQHTATRNGGQYCWDCHDPHGDKAQSGNTLFFMMQQRPWMKTVGQLPTEYAAAIEFRKETGGNSAVFPKTSNIKLDFQDYVAGGLCKGCHTPGIVAHFTQSLTDNTHFLDNGSNLIDAPNDKCVDCHRHTLGLKQLECNACHDSPSNVGKHRAHNNVSFQVGQIPQSFYATDSVATATEYGYACAKCHNGVHQNELGTHAGTAADPYPVEVRYDLNTLPKNDGGYVAVYNDTDVVGTDTTKVFSTTLSTTGNNGRCTNIYCHSSGEPLGRTPTYAGPQWGQGSSINCNGCHVVPGATASNVHTVHVTTYGYSCQRCHYPTTTNSSSVTDKRYHVDGIKTVGFDNALFSQGGGTYDSVGYTCSNTYCHSTGVTAPPGPYTSGPSVAWSATPGNCRACHGGNASASPTIGTASGSAKHANHVNNAANLGGVTYGCVQCHNATVSDDTTVSNLSNHVNGAKTVGFATIGSFTSGPYSSPPNCTNVYCHSSGGSESAGNPTYRSASWTEATWTGNWCNKCHGTGVSAGYPDYASGTAGSASANSHAKHVGTYGQDCSACHVSTTSSSTTLATGALHINGVDDVTIANAWDSDTTPTNNYTPGVGNKTCNNVKCHANAAGAYVSVQWGNNGAVGCNSCHNIPTTGTAAHLIHVDAAGKYRYACAQCHVATVATGSTTITDTTKHTNNVKEVQFDSTFSQNAGTTGGTSPAITCSNTYCHSDGQDNAAPYTSGPSLAWNTTRTCRSCHAGDATSTPIMGTTSGSAKHANHVNNAANLGGVTFGCKLCHATTVTDNNTVASTYPSIHVDGTRTVALDTIGGNSSGSYAAPNCSSSYCHSSGGNENAGGVTYATVAWTEAAWSGNWCNKCHGTGNTAGYPQYTSGGSGTPSANSHVKHVAGTAGNYSIGCAACHVSTAATNTTLATGTLHTNGADDVTIQAAYDSDALPANNYIATKTCQNVKCHANGAVTPSYANVQWGAAQSCSMCHGMPPTGTTAHAKHVTTYGYTCARCHVATVATGSATITDLTKHTNNLREVGFDALFSQGAGTTAGSSPAITCSNTYCHSNGQDLASPYVSGPSIAWNTTSACDSCHAGTMANTTKMSSGKHTQHINNVGVLGTNLTCYRCHSTTVNSSEAISTVANHVNQVVNTGFPEGGSYPAPPACSNVYCHSTGQATPTYKPVNWNDGAWATVCDKCHGTEAALFGAPGYASGAGGSATANSHAKHVSSAADCVICHANTTTTGLAIKAASTIHLDGQRQVTWDATRTAAGATYTSADKTCGSTGGACHGSGVPQWGGSGGTCLGCHEDTGATETDDLGPNFWNNSVKSTINTTEWAWSGHGKTTGSYDVTSNPAAAFSTSPTPGISECMYCHDDTVGHRVSTNPYRLRSDGGTEKNQACNFCHKTGNTGIDPDGAGASPLKTGTKKVATAHNGAKHDAGYMGGVFCWDCHDPHGDRKDGVTNSGGNNILMVQRQVLARSDGVYGYLADVNGARSVEFYNKNGPGALGTIAETATALGSLHKGLCQACHDTTVSPNPATAWTKYWNDGGFDDQDGPGGSAPVASSHGGQYCLGGCHKHQDEFKGAGESGGGAPCGSCHSSLFNPMNSTSNHHHYLNNSEASYGDGGWPKGQGDLNRNCLMCHVDHDLFRPDMNPANGGRGKNLRTDILVNPTTTTGLTNTDFDATLTNGGICTSCHRISPDGGNLGFDKAYTDPSGAPRTPIVEKAIYANSAHNYPLDGGLATAATFTTGGGGTNTFRANCLKCHNDTIGTSYQNSAQPNRYALHDSTLNSMNAKIGLTNLPDGGLNPVEEFMCWQCHRHSGDVIPNSANKPADGLDYYGAAPMTQRSEHIYTVFQPKSDGGYRYGHPVNATSNKHKVTGEGHAANDGTLSGTNRHTSCHDCHDPHGAKSSNQDAGSGTVSSFVNGTAPTMDQLKDGTKLWPSNVWKGYSVKIQEGTGAGQVSAIYGNDAGTLDVYFITAPDTTSKYSILSPGLATAATFGPNIDAWGVQPTTWPTPVTPPTWNDSAGTTTGVEITTQYCATGPCVATNNWTRYERPTNQGMVCLKCHSSYAYGTTPPNTPSGLGTNTDRVSSNEPGAAVAQGDKANEFNPNNLGHHAVFARGRNQPIIANYGNTGFSSVVNQYWPAYVGTAGDTVTVSSGTATLSGTAALPRTALPGWYIWVSSTTDTMPVTNPAAGTASSGFLEITAISPDSKSFTVRRCTANCTSPSPTWETNTTIAATQFWAVTAGLGNAFVPPMGPWSQLECSDCHTSEFRTDPFGPHGAGRKWMMRKAEQTVFAFYNGTAITEVNTGAPTDNDNTCLNCHRRDVYGDLDFFPTINAVPARYSRHQHPADSGNGSSLAKKNKWGGVCLNCHGGARIGAIHGTNLGKGNGGTAGSYSGKRLLAGSTWYGVTRSTTTTAGKCWTKGPTDAVDNCAKAHTGLDFEGRNGEQFATYNYDTTDP